MLDYRWSPNPPSCRRTVTPNWYRTYTIPKFGLQSSWITGACHSTFSLDQVLWMISEKIGPGRNSLVSLRSYSSRILSATQTPRYWFCSYNALVNLRIQPNYMKIWTRKNSVLGHFSRSDRLTLTVTLTLTQTLILTLSLYALLSLYSVQ